MEFKKDRNQKTIVGYWNLLFRRKHMQKTALMADTEDKLEIIGHGLSMSLEKREI